MSKCITDHMVNLSKSLIEIFKKSNLHPNVIALLEQSQTKIINSLTVSIEEIILGNLSESGNLTLHLSNSEHFSFSDLNIDTTKTLKMNNTANCPLKIVHINIKSIKNKKERLFSYMEENKIHIASVNEAWLNEGTKLTSKSFKIVRKNGLNRSGGVCLFISKSIPFDLIDLSSFEDEVVGISVKSGVESRATWNIFSLYNHPGAPINLNLFNFLNQSFDNVLLMGDLNMHHHSWNGKKDDTNGIALADFIKRNDWVAHNNSQFTFTPIHHPERHSLIDLVITNPKGSESIINFWVDENEDLGSDHIPITFEVKDLCFNPGFNQINTRSVSIISWAKFKTRIADLEPSLHL